MTSAATPGLTPARARELAAAAEELAGQIQAAHAALCADVDEHRRRAGFRLQDAADLYVPADAAPGPGTVATQRIPAGQLLPGSALGTADRLDRKPVAVPVDHPLPQDAGAGTRVDVWVAAQKPSS